jgi:hypothetical protein
MGKTYLIDVSESVRNIAAGWASPGNVGRHMASLATGAEVSLPGLWSDVQAIVRDHTKSQDEMICLWSSVCKFVAYYADWDGDAPVLVCPRCGRPVFPEWGMWFHKRGNSLMLECNDTLGAEAFWSLPIPQEDEDGV